MLEACPPDAHVTDPPYLLIFHWQGYAFLLIFYYVSLLYSEEYFVCALDRL